MLEIKLLHYTYPGSEQENLTDINLTIEDGSFVLLCGPSGCGKTTLTRVFNGLIPHYYEGELTGEATLDGTPYRDMSFFAISRKVGSVFQNPRSQFFNVDTTSELAFSAENHGVPKEEIRRRIDRTAEMLEAQKLLDRSIFSLSGGEKQKIACGSAAVMEPDVFVFDEPSSNLDSDAAQDLRKMLETLKTQGKTIIISEHRLAYVQDLADRVICLKEGRICGDYTAEAFRTLAPSDREAMGLRCLDLESLSSIPMPREAPAAGEWQCENFRFTYPHARTETVHIGELTLPKGQVTAIIGHNGAGKTTFMRCLGGLQKHSAGELHDGGKYYRRKQRLKLCYMVMQDVNHQLFTESVLEEVQLSMPEENEALAREYLARMDLVEMADRHPVSLSGGQKQRLAVSSALASERPIILFDEPTSGLDLRHMEEVAAVLQALADDGKTVVVVTHDPELILRCCHRVVHLEQGRVEEEYPLSCAQNRARLLQFFTEKGIVMEKKQQANPLATIWQWAAGQRGKFILSIVLAVLGSICQMLPYFCIAVILSRLLAGETALTAYLIPALLALVFFAGKVLLSSASSVISHKAAYQTLENLRLRALEKLQRVPMGTLLDTPTAAYKGLIVDRIEAMEVPLAHLMPELTANIVSPLLMLAGLFWLDWRLALLSLLPMAVSFVIMGIGMRNYAEEGAGALAATEKMTDAVVEYIGGIEVVKAFSQSAGSYEKYAHAVEDNARYYIDWMKRSQKTMCTYNAVLPSVLLTVLPGGLLFWRHGSLTGSVLLTAVMLSVGFIAVVSEAFSFANAIALLGKYTQDLEDLFNAPELDHGDTLAPIRDTGLSFRDVHFSYDGRKEVLHGISLDLKPHTMTAFVGPSGSGKSTLARLIAGFWDANSGSITLGGCDMKSIPLSQLNAQISYVSQDNYLFNRTVRENIRMGSPAATDEEVEQAAKRCGCDEFIRNLQDGYDTCAGSGGASLSGGERQRIAIARAMLKDAPIVILDEATAFMDPENEALVQRSISALTKDKMLIVIAHRLSTVTGADQIVVVNQGSVEACGTHEELRRTCPLYEAMWQSHISTRDEKHEVAQ